MDDKQVSQAVNETPVPKPAESIPVPPPPAWVDTISESTLTKGLESDINLNDSSD